MFKMMLASLVVTMFVIAGQAADCVVEVDRVACPDQKSEAFKPYDGKNPTKDKKETTKVKDDKGVEKKVKIDSKEMCLQELTSNCTIVRRDVLAKKTVWGSWDGKSIAEKSLCNSTDKLKEVSNSDCKP